MRSKIFWSLVGIVLAIWIEFTLVPHSQNPLLLHIIAGLIVLGGIARGTRGKGR